MSKETISRRRKGLQCSSCGREFQIGEVYYRRNSLLMGIFTGSFGMESTFNVVTT